MKKFIYLPILALTIALSANAADKEKEKTISGEGCCAKCELKEAKSCINAIKVKEGDKTTTYYIEHNDVAKAFHKNLCTATAKIKATGTFKETDGKKVFVATKIDLDK